MSKTVDKARRVAELRMKPDGKYTLTPFRKIGKKMGLNVKTVFDLHRQAEAAGHYGKKKAPKQGRS